MGCLNSKPAADTAASPAVRNDPSHKDTTTKTTERSVSMARKLPDFGLGSIYEVIKELGTGGTGETWLCTEKATGDKWAVKFIKRPIPSSMKALVEHELQIQQQLCRAHINIVTSKEAILTRSHLAIVMEFVAGGTLTSHVSDRWSTVGERNGLFLTEDETRYFFKQFVQAVEYCHDNHIVHRDLKLDNTLLDNSNPPRVKLIDFGFAKHWDEDQNMHTHIGTPVYMSPQLISSGNAADQGYDGRKADIWALGVLVFVMLLGMFPFEHAEHPDPNTSKAHAEVLLEQIETNWKENPRIAEKAAALSPECIDLLDGLFNLDEKVRPSIAEIKKHPWYNQPLSPHFQAELDAIAMEQDILVKAGSSVVLVNRGYANSPKLTQMMKLVEKEGSSSDLVRYNFMEVLQAAAVAAAAAAAANPEPAKTHPHLVRPSAIMVPDMETIAETDE